MNPKRLFQLTLALISLSGTAVVSAQTVINAVPYTISAAGKYVLGGNLNNTSTSTPAITVNAPNVQLDLNGFYVSGAQNTASTNAVIRVNDVANVAIRNGLLSNDGYGIYFVGINNSRNYVVEEVTVSRCYVYGIYITNAAPGSRLRNNSFSNLGNAAASGNTYPGAIFASGGVRIEGNTVATVTAAGSGTSVGMNIYDGDFCIGNTISNCYYGVVGGKYQDNLTFGCTTAFDSGIDAGGNN